MRWLLVVIIALAGCSRSSSEATAVEFCGKTYSDPMLSDLVSCRAPMPDLTKLSKIRGMKSLELKGTQTRSLDGLRGAPELTELVLVETEVQDIGAVSELPALVSFRVHISGQVRDLGPLADAERLEVLELAQTPVSDLRPIAQLPKLRVLKLVQEQLPSTWPTHIPRAEQLASLDALVRATALEELSILGTQVSDLSPLASLPRLRRLSLVGCKGVVDLSPLLAIPTLTSLEVSKELEAEANRLQAKRPELELRLL